MHMSREKTISPELKHLTSLLPKLQRDIWLGRMPISVSTIPKNLVKYLHIYRFLSTRFNRIRGIKGFWTAIMI